MQDQMFTDRHAAKQLGLLEIDDGHVVAFDIRRIGARACGSMVTPNGCAPTLTVPLRTKFSRQ